MASFISFINIPVFITALALGLFVYLGNNGDERKITVYPTPENIRLLMYKDHTGTCFGFKRTQVTCPKTRKK
jgi:hypothetical protein